MLLRAGGGFVVACGIIYTTMHARYSWGQECWLLFGGSNLRMVNDLFLLSLEKNLVQGGLRRGGLMPAAAPRMLAYGWYM